MEFFKAKHKRRIFIVVASVVLVLAVMVGVCAIYLGDYYRADEAAIQAFLPQNVQWKKEDDGMIVFGQEEATKGFIKTIFRLTMPRL